MPGILVFCRSCGKEVGSAEVRDGLCLECRVDRELADLRDEHLRLWRKRERYQGRGAGVGSIDTQIDRLEDRMAAHIVALVPDKERARELLQGQLKRARRSRYDIRRP